MKSLVECVFEEHDDVTRQDILEAICGSADEGVLKGVDVDEFVDAFFEYTLNNSTIKESNKDIIDYIREAQLRAMENDTELKDEVDEGLIAGVLGTLGGVAFGPKVGQAICNALNISKGVLYDLLTSRLVTTAICAKLGFRA